MLTKRLAAELAGRRATGNGSGGGSASGAGAKL